MPTAMRLAVLVSLFAMTVFIGTTAAKRGTDRTTSTAHSASLATKGSVDTPFSATTASSTQQPPTTHHITTGGTSENVSSTSPQTPNRTEGTHPSVSPPQATTTNQTSNGTVSYRSTSPPASESNVTATSTVNTTSPGLSHEWGKGDLAANPGLVVIICIFCIICAVVLVVATVRCVRSPRSNFERLQDVPMSNVNEESPFARHSK